MVKAVKRRPGKSSRLCLRKSGPPGSSNRGVNGPAPFSEEKQEGVDPLRSPGRATEAPKAVELEIEQWIFWRGAFDRRAWRRSACCCALRLASLCNIAMDARRYGPCAGRKRGPPDLRRAIA